MIGPRGIYIDDDQRNQDTFFDPKAVEVRENPPAIFAPISEAERGERCMEIASQWRLVGGPAYRPREDPGLLTQKDRKLLATHMMSDDFTPGATSAETGLGLREIVISSRKP